MKLQINSLEALERLIGGDTDIEIEIRNNIVQEFTKKHLKAIVNEGTIKRVADNLNKTLSAQAESIINDKFGSLGGDYWNPKFVLNAKCQNELNAAAESAYIARIRSAWQQMEKRVLDRYSDEYIESEIKRTVNREVNKRIEAGVQAKLAAIKNSI